VRRGSAVGLKGKAVGENMWQIFTGKRHCRHPILSGITDLGQAHISDLASRKLVLSTSTALLLYVKRSLINIFPTDIHCIKEFSRDINVQSPSFISEMHLQK